MDSKSTNNMWQREGIFACTLVKWKSPEDELINVANLAHKIALNGGFKPNRVCVAASCDAWISQFFKACNSQKIPAVICLPVRKLTPDAARVVATIDFLASAQSGTAQSDCNNLSDFGITGEEANEILQKCKNAKGFTLVKLCGLLQVKQLHHIAKLVDGDEDALRLSKLVHEQLEHPRTRENSDEITITSYRDVYGSFDAVFYIACVDGLNGANAPKCVDGLDGAQHDIVEVPKSAEVPVTQNDTSIFISYFTHIDKQIADAAHIRYSRCKTAGNKQVAVCKPARFIDGARMQRPSTTSGQALLATYGISWQPLGN